MKNIFITAIAILCMVSYGNAQDYKTGIGFRGGFSQGLTAKHFISEKVAIEGILASRHKGFIITGLYELHTRAFEVDRLNFYYGFGGHIGFGDGSKDDWGNEKMILGIDGILGLEYSFTSVPFNIGVDWKPAFNLAGGENWGWGDSGALSIRYIF